MRWPLSFKTKRMMSLNRSRNWLVNDKRKCQMRIAIICRQRFPGWPRSYNSNAPKLETFAITEELHVPHQHSGAGPLANGLRSSLQFAATLGGIVGHEASHVANDAILYKNEAVLKKTDAANQWAYYQAVSTKSHLMELAKQLTPEQTHPGYDERLAKYAQQKDELQAKVTALEKQVVAADAKSAALREPRQNLFLSLALFQIAISVASVTVLSRQRWLFGVAIAGALGGIGFWMMALLAH